MNKKDKKPLPVLKKCAKWLSRFTEGGCLNFSPEDPTCADAFVVLNGGLTAGSSVFEVRRAIDAHGLTRECVAGRRICHFSYGLYFVLVSAPLDVSCVTSLVACGPLGALIDSRDAHLAVYALPVENQKRKREDLPSSSMSGCGFLFLLPVSFALVFSKYGSAFQRPVVNAPDFTGRIVVDAIPGLEMVAEFVSEAESTGIMQELTAELAAGVAVQDRLCRRRVIHFNRRFIYGTNTLGDVGEGVGPNPAFFGWLQARLAAVSTANGRVALCDQLTVNFYDYLGSNSGAAREGGRAGIAAHVDAHSALGDHILIVSLGSGTVMEFARWDAPDTVSARIGVYIPPRSLVVMGGESRYAWTHCIAERNTDCLDEFTPPRYRENRVSLTWRCGREAPHLRSTCPCPALCDAKVEE